MQDGKQAARLGILEAPDPSKLKKEGGVLFSDPDATPVAARDVRIETGTLEGANVDPASELARLMDTQRELEANANMIRYQDSTLDKLVNQVGKIS